MHWICLECVYQLIELWFHYLVSWKMEIGTSIPIFGKIIIWIGIHLPKFDKWRMLQLCSWYFQNKQEHESRFVLLFIFWNKKWPIELFCYIFMWLCLLTFEEFKEVSVQVFISEEFVIWLAVKVSWFFNFFEIIKNWSENYAYICVAHF